MGTQTAPSSYPGAVVFSGRIDLGTSPTREIWGSHAVCSVGRSESQPPSASQPEVRAAAR